MEALVVIAVAGSSSANLAPVISKDLVNRRAANRTAEENKFQQAMTLDLSGTEIVEESCEGLMSSFEQFAGELDLSDTLSSTSTRSGSSNWADPGGLTSSKLQDALIANIPETPSETPKGLRHLRVWSRRVRNHFSGSV